MPAPPGGRTSQGLTCKPAGVARAESSADRELKSRPREGDSREDSATARRKAWVCAPRKSVISQSSASRLQALGRFSMEPAGRPPAPTPPQPRRGRPVGSLGTEPGLWGLGCAGVRTATAGTAGHRCRSGWPQSGLAPPGGRPTGALCVATPLTRALDRGNEEPGLRTPRSQAGGPGRRGRGAPTPRLPGGPCASRPFS